MEMEMLMGNETNVTKMAMEGNGIGVLDYINKSMWMTMRRCRNMSEIRDENTSENTNENSSSDMPGTPCKQMGIYLVSNTMYLKLVIGSTLPNLSFWQKAG
jgi:hypothetical protein